MGDLWINVIADIDNSICVQESFDTDNVDDSGCELEDLFERFGVDVKGTCSWKESLLGSNDDPSMFIICLMML